MNDSNDQIGSLWRVNMNAKGEPGEVHSSIVPIILSLAVTLTLAALLFWPFIIFGLPLLVWSIVAWVKEDVALWEFREISEEKTGNASWAMIWIIITEVIIFSGFFAFWFWARWHTVSWNEAIASSTWPPAGLEHNLALVGFNTILLVSSGIIAHLALRAHENNALVRARNHLKVTILFGIIFLVIQIYEYANSDFTWQSHSYGSAFFALTGLHGLHVLFGIIALSVIFILHKKGHYDNGRIDSFQAAIWYWHFVDVVWVLLFFIVYLEVI